jgi:hypothetical protein
VSHLIRGDGGVSACTAACEAMPECARCGLRKKPRGRSAPLEMANGLCDFECDGYDQEPRAGHLWPGELERPSGATKEG